MCQRVAGSEAGRWPGEGRRHGRHGRHGPKPARRRTRRVVCCTEHASRIARPRGRVRWSARASGRDGGGGSEVASQLPDRSAAQVTHAAKLGDYRKGLPVRMLAMELLIMLD